MLGLGSWNAGRSVTTVLGGSGGVTVDGAQAASASAMILRAERRIEVFLRCFSAPGV